MSLTTDVVALVLALGLSACQDRPVASTSTTMTSTTSTTTTSTILPGAAEDSPRDVRKKFEALFAQHQALLTARLPERRTVEYDSVTARGKDKYVFYAEFRFASYDIVRTESIVFPYRGTATYWMKWFANDKYIADQSIEATYRYSDGTWSLSSGVRIGANGKPVEEVDDIAWVRSLFR